MFPSKKAVMYGRPDEQLLLERREYPGAVNSMLRGAARRTVKNLKCRPGQLAVDVAEAREELLGDAEELA